MKIYFTLTIALVLHVGACVGQELPKTADHAVESTAAALPSDSSVRDLYSAPTDKEAGQALRLAEEIKRSPCTPVSRWINPLRNFKSEEAAGGRRAPASQNGTGADKFQWGPAIKQSLLFLAVQHSYALTQPKTRRSLRGPFLKDYFRSVRSLSGWEDGGRFFTNYIAHPMQGSFLGFIQVQNDPSGRNQSISGSPHYWKSRLKALAWSAAWSTQFEIGPISQASIGNVGLYGKQTYVDIVMTPTAGLAMLLAEDTLDKYVVRRIERHMNNFYLKILLRMILNPTRTVANVVRFKTPWYRDSGLR
ncbi:MAG: hypothetical protein ABR530_06375 [Pyrinomonadaceae bacterium]